MVNALGDATGMSPKMNWPALSAVAGDLLSCEYTAGQVAAYYGREATNGRWNWYLQDWRGRRNDLPTPKQIKETIRGAIDWQPDRASPGGNGNGHDPPSRPETSRERARRIFEEISDGSEISNRNEQDEWAY
jgi:hypothetical protein